MPSQTNEAAFESLIYNYLVDRNHYQTGNPSDYDPNLAIDTAKLWQFLEKSQPDQLKKLQDSPDWQRMILERIDRKLKKDGVIAVLKKGIAIHDANLTLYFSQPYNHLNPDIQTRFEQNIFSVTRQVHFSPSDRTHSIDLVIFLNGLAIASIELKNPWTGQTVHHAKQQYCNRNPKDSLFNFARCLVHFAADPDEVWMTTQLNGKSTYFLPFNRGDRHGKGNPVNPNGYKTSYLWEDVLAPSSLATVLEHFALLAGKPNQPIKDKTLIFPRYHQRDAVNQLLKDAQQQGTGKTYLIQHSAGSGKSNTITWLAFQLIQLYQAQQDEPLFHSVIVVTDRRNLDKQLRENIDNFSEVKNIIAAAHRSEDLKIALESGKKIIVSTIQKFSFIVKGIEALGDRRFAVIIDEAHSSQSGASADTLNQTLSQTRTNHNPDNDENEQPEDIQDKILSAIQGRKLSPNASYFAFTATPKNTTLEKFGMRQPDGSFAPCHLYSMKQAIEEGFILDVLANYTTYRSYYQIQKSISENPEFDANIAQKKLKAYVESNPQTIATKAEIMINHFIENVVRTKKLKGQAHGMVITRNINTAILYYFEIQKLLKEKNAGFGAIVAFSGSKMVNGIEHTEDSLNGFPSKEIEAKFKSNDYRLLVVANKFLTGFDEPLLHTMYVDKPLQGVLAVQALSRLNRCNNKQGKTETFVLDFANTISDIQAAFDPFYTATSLSEATDVNVLHDLKESLDRLGVYELSEVDEFNQRFFAGIEGDSLKIPIDTAANRFNHELDLSDEDKIDYKIKAKQFVKIYGQIACLIPFNNLHWEKLYWFLKFLIPSLVVKNPQQDALDELLNSVDLATYGVERVSLNAAIALDEKTSALAPQNPNPRGYHAAASELSPLDEIITAFNNAFAQAWDAGPDEQKIKLVNIARSVANHPSYQTQVLDNPDPQNSRLAIAQLIKQAINEERRRELSLYKNYSQDRDFQTALESSIIRILEIAINHPDLDLLAG